MASRYGSTCMCTQPHLQWMMGNLTSAPDAVSYVSETATILGRRLTYSNGECVITIIVSSSSQKFVNAGVTCEIKLLGRPTYYVGGLIFYQGFFFLSFFFSFVSYPRSSLNRTQPYLPTWSEVSVIRKCMSEIWGIPPPTNRGPKTTFLDDFATQWQL